MNILKGITPIIKVKYGYAANIKIMIGEKLLVVQEFAETKKKLQEKLDGFDIQRYAYNLETNEYYTL